MSIITKELNNIEKFELTAKTEKELSTTIYKFEKSLGIYYKPSSPLKIPHIYALPKLHKNPIKFRIITNGTNSYIHNIDYILSEILKHITNKIITKNKVSFIKNSYTIAKFINDNLNFYNTIYTFDFENLYGSLNIKEVQKIIKNIFIEELRDNSLEIKTLQYNKSMFIDTNKAIKILDMFMNFLYITFNDNIYLQKIGLPMGTKSSSILCNLYLYVFEKINYSMIKNNSILFRYVDDLLVLNDNNFLNNSPNIYPNYLKLIPNEISGSTNTSVNYLDLNINLNSNNITVFDKRSIFQFKINKFCHKSSNISASVFKNIWLGQFIRFYRIINNKNNFIYAIKDLINEFINNGHIIFHIKYWINISIKKYLFSNKYKFKFQIKDFIP